MEEGKSVGGILHGFLAQLTIGYVVFTLSTFYFLLLRSTFCLLVCTFLPLDTSLCTLHTTISMFHRGTNCSLLSALISRDRLAV